MSILTNNFKAVAMFGGVAVICTVNYIFQGRKVYKGPVVYIRKDA